MLTYRETVKRYERILKLKEERFHLREIAKKLGLTHQRISQILLKGEPKKINPKYKYPAKLRAIINNKNLGGRERTREIVRFRDKYICQDCGLKRTPEDCKMLGKRALDIHHLNGLCGKRSRKSDKVSLIPDLVTLCHQCHFRRPEHRVHSKEYAENMSVAKRAWYLKSKIKVSPNTN